MEASRDGASSGPGGSGGSKDAGGGGGHAGGGSGGVGGQGGTTAVGGSAGGSAGHSGTGGNVDAGCNLVADASADHSTTACTAMFNFESGKDGAVLAPSTTQQAFTALAIGAAPHTYCGSGSLAITAAFSDTMGVTTKGEVDVPLGVDGGTANLLGKTLTIHIAASPVTCGEDLRFSAILDTATGEPVVLRENPITSSFSTLSATLTADAGASAATTLALEFFSTSSYTGTIYIDEIDIR